MSQPTRSLNAERAAASVAQPDAVSVRRPDDACDSRSDVDPHPGIGPQPGRDPQPTRRPRPARPLTTRSELADWAYRLLPDPFACPAYIGASYSLAIRQLEWGLRPLWTVFSLMAAGDADPHRIEPFLAYIRAGLTPGSAFEFPQPSAKTRQIALEMGVYGYGLLACGDRLLAALEPAQRDRLAAWLNAINDLELPWGSWFAYRLLVNAGLRAAGLPFGAARVEADRRALESMYAGDGWYEDGTPFQRDYHIPMSFHLVALLLARYEAGAPVEVILERARAFARDFSWWFGPHGRSLPFGRSLVYRFGHASFWSALALADPQARASADVKGLLMDALSWWHAILADQHDRLVVGYAYPNLMVGEDYTGPGALFQAFQAFVVLGLPEGDPFWALESHRELHRGVHAEPRPGMIICAGKHHTYALSATQYSIKSILQRMSKYGKLCYSTAFGWNISRDTVGIENFAVDSALALSVAGTDQFAARGRILDGQVHDGYVYSLWDYGDVARVETVLIPVDERVHVRLHRVSCACPLVIYEGGFPVFGWSRKFDVSEVTEAGTGIALWRAALPPELGGQRSAIYDAADPAVAARVRAALVAAGLGEAAERLDECTPRTACVVRQNPDTNIYDCEANAVPALKVEVPSGTFGFACLVEGDPGQVLA